MIVSIVHFQIYILHAFIVTLVALLWWQLIGGPHKFGGKSMTGELLFRRHSQMRTIVIFAHPGSWKSVSNIKMNKHLLKVYFVFDIQKTWKDNTVLPLEVPLIFGTGDWQSTPIPLLDHEGVKSTFRLCNNRSALTYIDSLNRVDSTLLLIVKGCNNEEGVEETEDGRQFGGGHGGGCIYILHSCLFCIMVSFLQSWSPPSPSQ